MRQALDRPAAAPPPEVLHYHFDRVPDERRAGNEPHAHDGFHDGVVVARPLTGTKDEAGISVACILDPAKLGNVDVLHHDRFGEHFDCDLHAESPLLPQGSLFAGEILTSNEWLNQHYKRADGEQRVSMPASRQSGPQVAHELAGHTGGRNRSGDDATLFSDLVPAGQPELAVDRLYIDTRDEDILNNERLDKGLFGVALSHHGSLA